MMRNWFAIFLLFTLFSCQSDRLDIKVQGVVFEPIVERLDLEFALAKSRDTLFLVHNKFAENHEEFYNFYLGACLQIRLIDDSAIVDALYDFVKDPYMIRLHGEIKNTFPNLDDEVAHLGQGFSFLAHHFPKATQPTSIIFYNSLFTNSVVSSENTIGVGIERYLGEDNPAILELPEEPFYPYIKKRMDKRFMVRDMMMSWIGANLLPEIQDEKELADVMIQWGKHFYVLEACFPKMEKDKILRYFPEEYAWAIKNEKEFWNYLVAQNSLFKRDYKMALNIFSDGPFTSGLPIEDKAPPRLGQFLGWRIVKKYMNKNKDVSLEQLLQLDFKTIIKSYD